MGFTKEGVIRWERVIAKGKEGLYREGGLPGVHVAVLGVCWDEWESTVKDKVQVMMDRSRAISPGTPALAVNSTM